MGVSKRLREAFRRGTSTVFGLVKLVSRGKGIDIGDGDYYTRQDFFRFSDRWSWEGFWLLFSLPA